LDGEDEELEKKAAEEYPPERKWSATATGE
jgi:hypothetical protein